MPSLSVLRRIWGPFVLVATVLASNASLIAQDSTDTEAVVREAIDFAKSGMIDEAKQMLIPLLHDAEDSTQNPRIRYILGSICYFEEDNLDCTNYHWNIVLKESPNSPSADAIREMRRTSSFFDAKLTSAARDDLLFLDQMRLARRLWNYEPPDWKMDWDDIKGADIALDYLQYIHDRFDDPFKKAIVLYDAFLINAGCNKEGYGLSHTYEFAAAGRRNQKWDQALLQCEQISDSLSKLEGGEDLYVQSQFLLGVLTSGTKFLSSKISLKERSVKYFEAVVRATEGQDTNPYRVFASFWLKDYYN